MSNLEKIESLLKLNKTKLALDLILEALSTNPYDSHLLFLAGFAKSIDYKNDEAEVFFLKSLEQNPESFDTYNQLTIIAFRRKDYKNLELLATKSIELNPNQSHAYFNLAQKHLKTGNIKAAKENCERGLRNDPESSRGKAIKSQIHLLEDDSQTTISLLKESLKESPENVDLLFQLAVYYLKGNDKVEANKLFKECLRLDPDNLSLKSEIKKTISSHLPLFKNSYSIILKSILWHQEKLEIYATLIFILSIMGALVYNVFVDFNWVESIIFLFFLNLNLLLSFILLMNNLSSMFLLFHPLGKVLLSRYEWLSHLLVVLLIILGYVITIIGIKGIYGGQTSFAIMNGGLFLVFIANMYVRLKKQFIKSNFNLAIVYLVISCVLFILILALNIDLLFNCILLLTLPLTMWYSLNKKNTN